MALDQTFDCTSGTRGLTSRRERGESADGIDDRPGQRLNLDRGSPHGLEFTASRWRERTIAFSSCGKRSSVAWGGVSNADRLCAVYFVHWACSAPDHPAYLDLIVGPWGQDGSAAERRLLALRYLPRPNGGELVVIDGASRPAASSALCARVFTADTFAAAPDADRIQAMLAALWMNEPAVAELRALDAMSMPRASS